MPPRRTSRRVRVATRRIGRSRASRDESSLFTRRIFASSLDAPAHRRLGTRVMVPAPNLGAPIREPSAIGCRHCGSGLCLARECGRRRPLSGTFDHGLAAPSGADEPRACEVYLWQGLELPDGHFDVVSGQAGDSNVVLAIIGDAVPADDYAADRIDCLLTFTLRCAVFEKHFYDTAQH